MIFYREIDGFEDIERNVSVTLVFPISQKMCIQCRPCLGKTLKFQSKVNCDKLVQN